MNNKIFWFDTETTGLDFRKHDMIQIAYLVEINKDIKEEGKFYVQPFNYDTIDKGSLAVNKLEIATIKTFPSPQEIHRKIKSIIEKYVDRYNKNDKFSPAGYNVRFDVDFLREFFFKNNDKYYGSLFDYHVLDVFPFVFTLEYAGKIKLENYKLETLCKFFEIPLNAHDALEDVKATRLLYHKLLTFIK